MVEAVAEGQVNDAGGEAREGQRFVKVEAEDEVGEADGEVSDLGVEGAAKREVSDGRG